MGIARYIRRAEDSHAADMAVTIVDERPGRGLGTELLTQLSDRARQEGIRRFSAPVAAENLAVGGLLRNMYASLVRRESNTLVYEITLAPCEEADRERVLFPRDDRRPDRPGEGAARIAQTSNVFAPPPAFQHAAGHSRTPGAVAGAETGGQMSTTYRRRPQREATSAGSAWADGQTGNGHAVQEGDGIACLDMLAAQLHARGWTAYVNTPTGRLTSLFAQDPRDRAVCGDIIAAPSGPAGGWWYWFSWAERIAPVKTPAAAADAIIRAFQRPVDAALVPLSRG